MFNFIYILHWNLDEEAHNKIFVDTKCSTVPTAVHESQIKQRTNSSAVNQSTFNFTTCKFLGF